ncbi:MAG: carbon storage regulator CsrA [Melioribacteraceae bacterium]|nr:carbon storage regulator CsrA [Melioribacteraceae bacterium]
MLVLKRKQNEKIRIGSDIVVNIISVSDHQVKIGIDAPDDVKILREEIYEKLKIHAVESSQQSKEINIKELSSLDLNKINKKNQ